MKKTLMFFVATALVFGFAGVTGATQFTLSDIDDLNPDISVDSAASVGDPVLTLKGNSKPPKLHKPKKHKNKKPKKRKNGPAHVPEPATMLLFGAGLIGLAVAGRKKLQQRNIE